ncbi:MAG: hypothetical protein JXR13_13135 [Thalassovita sp.]
MFIIQKLSLAAGLFALATAAHADPVCAAFTEGKEVLDPLIYADLPDPLTERVSDPIEADLLRDMLQSAEPQPLSKVYCKVGMFEMRIRFVQPVQDDSVAAFVTEALYEWQAQAEPAGWQLSALTRQLQCARGDAEFAPICP